MKGHLTRRWLSATLLALVSMGASAAPAPIRLTDLRELVRIGSPQFSPDGTSIAFLTLRSDFVHDSYDATLRVIPTQGGEPRTLVEDIHDIDMPRWSSDGRSLAFIGKVGNREPQIYTIPAMGGTPTELSDARNGVQQYAWSPDGNSIAYVTPDDSPLSDKDRRTHHDLFDIHDDDYLVDKPPVPSHIWLLSVKDGKSRQITRGASSVLETPAPISGGPSEPSWSADGRWIVYAQQADADDSDSDRTTIVAVNVASGEERPLTDQRTYEYTPRFAPKGDAVAYLYLHGPGAISDVDLFVVSADGGAVRDMSASLDRSIASSFAWLPDGSGVVVMADDHVGVKLYVQPLHGHGRALNLGTLNPLDVASSAEGSLAVVADSATRAPELYLLRTPDSRRNA